MTDLDFADIRYLKNGSPVQQAGYCVLIKSGIFKKLAPYNPILTGTLPLDIFIDGSDLDICCEVYNHIAFASLLKECYGNIPDFTLKQKFLEETESTVCAFSMDNFIFEIVGQPLPVRQQQAYRHMVIEYAVLQKRGEPFKQKIIELKKQGLKTEPAFAQLLKLTGDPYEALLSFTD
ncbi:MAG: DUF4269 domain-containing protein [Cyclobacteriaceae bacterium]|nr:DUF4269 domain-containing protein [Cyclobacteriaceae bacterium]